jgi:hypothetical protein
LSLKLTISASLAAKEGDESATSITTAIPTRMALALPRHPIITPSKKKAQPGCDWASGQLAPE